ncbi:MAG: GNAT family N-acetyltransferase [Pseudomonadota bacterium]
MPATLVPPGKEAVGFAVPAEPTRLCPSDAERYMALRKRMLADAPWAFTATAADDVALDIEFLRTALARDDNAILAVVEDGGPELLAVAGIYRMENPKFAHRAKLWGVFVDARHRGIGLGRAVTTAALALATNWRELRYIDVGVSENSTETLGLYQSLGFVEWGREPEATQHGSHRYDEIHMSLRV